LAYIYLGSRHYGDKRKAESERQEGEKEEEINRFSKKESRADLFPFYNLLNLNRFLVVFTTKINSS